MSLVALAQLRFLMRSYASVLSALLGLTLGVASVVGVHLLSERVERQISSNAQPLGEVDVYLQRQDLRERHYFELRRRWRAGELPQIKGLFPLVDGRVRFEGNDYQLVGSDPLALTGSGVFGVPGTSGSSVPERGAASVPSAARRDPSYLISDSVLVPQDLLDAHGLDAALAQPSAIRINELSLSVLGVSGIRATIVTDLPSAQRILDLDGRLSRVAIQLHAPSHDRKLGARLRRWASALFPGALAAQRPRRLLGLDPAWEQVSVADATPALRLTRSILFNIAALSMLSLIVAWLLTYQVAQHAIERRQAMFARLHSLGVSNRELSRLTLLEGSVAGLVAVGLGLLLGRALANGLFVAVLGSSPDPALPIGPWVVGKALVSGLGVSMVSYAIALRLCFRRETEVARASARLELVRPWHKYTAAALFMGFVWGALHSGSGLVGAFLTIVACALAVVLFTPLLMSRFWRASLTPSSPEFSKPPSAVLPIRQLLVGRELRLGISALTLAIATALGISVMVDSFRAAFVDLLDRRLVDDVALEIDAAGGLERLEIVLAGQSTRALLRGNESVLCDGVRGTLEYASDDVLLAKRFGASIELAAGELLISESFAYFNSVERNSKVTLRGTLGSQDFRVAGIFADFGEVVPRVVLRRADAAQVVDAQHYTQALIQSSDPTRLRASLGAAGIEFTDPRDTKAQALAIFEQTFGITRALTALALIVAVVAMANALSAQGLALAPSDNLLRVLGIASRSALLLRVRRASLAGLLAVGMALPLGLGMAWLLCNLVNPRAFGWQFPLQLTPSAMLWPIAGGLAALAISALMVWQPRTPDPVGSAR